jgi:hypothetical protein
MKAAVCVALILVCLVVAAAQRPSELYGYVKYQNNSPAKGVVVSIGNFNVATDKNGYYKVTFLKPGWKVVSLTPPGKVTRSFKVMVGSTSTQKDFVVNW